MRFSSLLLLPISATLAFAGVVFEPADGLFVTRGGPRAFVTRDHVEWPTVGVRMDFSSVAGSSNAEALEPVPGRVDYRIGNDPSKWRLGVNRYARVRYRAIVPKTDLVYHGSGSHLEFDFILAPGASPKALTLRFDGASVRLSNNSLIATGKLGEVRLHRPLAWQEVGGKQVPVTASFRMGTGASAGFEVGAYDRGLPLIIDPIVQVATYYGGGTGNESNIQMVTDPAGNVYLAGQTDSTDLPEATFPGSPYNRPVQLLHPICFLTRLHPDATTLDYSIYFGGSGGDSVLSLVRDNLGFIHVLGQTNSPNFPVAPTAWRSSILPSSPDSFWAKFDPQTGKLLASTFLGVPSQSYVVNPNLRLAVDSVGEPFIGGNGVPAFSSTAGAYSTNVNISGFLLRLNATGTGVTYATGVPTGVTAMQVDAAGGVVFASDGQNGPFSAPAIINPLPGTGAPPYGGYGYIARLNPSGSALTFGSYLGTGFTGSGIISITADPSGNMHILGFAETLGVPVTNPVHLGPGGASGTSGPYWVVLQANTFKVLAATWFNDGSPSPTQLAFLPNGSTCMFVNSIQQAPGGLVLSKASQAGLTCLDQSGAQYFTTAIPQGISPLQSSLQSTQQLALAPASDGGVWIAGQTNGYMQTTPGVIQPNFAGGYRIDEGIYLSGPTQGTDAALVKLSPLNPTPTIANVTPAVAVLGPAGITFYVNGSGFAYGTQLLWNGTPITAMIANNNQISAGITDPNLLQPGTAVLTVSLPGPGGGVSNPVNLQLLNASPSQLFVSPSQVSAGSSPVGLLLTGTNLLPTSSVTWDGQPRSAKYATQFTQGTLQITLLASDLATPGSHVVAVANPSPGGGSVSAEFTVTGASTALTLTVTVPVNVYLSSGMYSVGLGGTGLAGSAATWDGTPVASTVNGNSIILAVPPALLEGQSRHVAAVTQGGQTASTVVYAAVPLSIGRTPAIDRAGQRIYFLSPTQNSGPTTLIVTDFGLRTLNTVTLNGNLGLAAVSDDGSFVYFLDNVGATIYRFNTSTMSVDLQFAPDPAFYGVISGLVVLPGQPDSVAATTSVAWVIFDHGVPRPNIFQNSVENIFAITSDRGYFLPFITGCQQWIGYDEFGFSSSSISSCDPALTGSKQDSLLSYLSAGSKIVPISFGNLSLSAIFPDLPDRHVLLVTQAGIVDWNLDSLSSAVVLSPLNHSAFQLDNTRLLILSYGYGNGFVFDRTNP